MKSKTLLLATLAIVVSWVTAAHSFHTSVDVIYAKESEEYPEHSTVPVRTFRASDEEGTVLAWFLTGVDGGDFRISEGVLSFKSPPDYEHPTDANEDNIYEVAANVTDGVSTTTADLTVTVVNIEEPGNLALSSLQPEADIPLIAELADPDGNVSGMLWQWSVSADRSGWTPINGAISNTYTPVEADVGSYLRVAVSYSDGEGSGKSARAISLNVVREMHPSGHGPEFPPDETGARTIAENSPSGTPIGNPVTATDEAGHILTYTIGGTDAASFGIDRSSGQLLTRSSLDYEIKNSFAFLLTVADPTNASVSIPVSVMVSNLEEEGTITLSTPQPYVGSEMIAFLDDPDGDVTEEVWSWERSLDRVRWEVIEEQSSDRYTPDDIDLNRYYRVSVNYADGEGSGKIAQAISFNPVKEELDHAPRFPATENGLREIPENTPPGTPIGAPFTATDSDGHTLTYLLLDELDVESFDIDINTGQLFTKAPLDYEIKSIYRLTLAVHDNADEHEGEDHQLDAVLAVTIVVTDVDEEEEEETVMDACVDPLPASGTLSESWTESCISTNRPRSPDGHADRDYFARYFTFTLEETSDVVVELASVHDTYVYLLEGGGRDGNVLESNDDLRPHEVTDSRIVMEALTSGIYTIEATTYHSEIIGDFLLSVVISPSIGMPMPPDPRPVPSDGYTAVSSGANHVCALTTEGSVMCWGADDFGQVSERPNRGTFMQISCGDNHACALRDDGAVVCWGSVTVP